MFVALWRLLVGYGVCRIMTFVGYYVCRNMMFVAYGVCRSAKFSDQVANFFLYILLPYIIYVIESGRFSHSPAFLSRTTKERDKKYSVKTP